MKDSGIDWIGKIPDEWTTRQIRYLFEIRDERNYKPLSEVNLISVYTDKGVLQHSDIEQTTGNKAQNADGYKHVYKNDLVVNIILCWMGALGISDFDGVTSPAYDVYSPKNLDLIFPKYYHYLFRTPQFNGKCYTEGRGIMQMRWRTYSSEFKSIKIPLPPLPEQTKIANFLDKKCAQIDSIIEESKKSIEEYKSWKQSVVFEAVTGKNLSCKKKDSGIEWLGEIPEEWEARALKTIFRIFSGTTPKSDIIEYWDGDVNWVTPADFKTEDVYVENGKRNISENGFSDCSLELIPINSLIFSKRAPIGKVCVNRNEMCTNQGCLACVKKINLSIKFFYYLLSSLTEYFEVLGSGTTFKEISLTSFSDFKVLFPPLSEQESVAKALDAKCAQIDSLISEKQSLIKDLAEYKKSLIFEAVTGKRRV
ncbi:restriction endonuclease subunit S [Treponema succinifaciens]|uniref:restriction endonuclease subunit S n=1 Tax=Treponema succinifaciens TaxID=167 RepID=UPI0023F0E54B|nr:restriction endonuclease subunit S [Treponema succinifaciens]